jgi:hypothetical protein
VHVHDIQLSLHHGFTLGRKSILVFVLSDLLNSVEHRMNSAKNFAPIRACGIFGRVWVLPFFNYGFRLMLR